MKNDNFFGKDWASAQKEIDKQRTQTDPLWPETEENPNYKLTLGKFAEGAEAETCWTRKLPKYGKWIRTYYPLDLPESISVKYTRFEPNNIMGTFERLLADFISWTESLKGRLPVPPYDIADPRIDEEKEEEFFNIVRKRVYASIIKDAEKYARPGEKTSYDENSIKRLSYSFALVFCAYYHHSFDKIIANETLY